MRNGVAPLHPSPCAASLHARLCATTSASGASESRPAIGSGHSASTRPSSTATIPPPISTSRSIANAMSSSDMPTTTRLWASWATDDASAPRCSPDPETKPSPVRPVARCRSTTAIFARSRSASATAWPADTAGSRTSDSVTTWSVTRPIARMLDPSTRRRSRPAETGLHADALPHPVGDLDGRRVLDPASVLQHHLGHEVDEVGKDEQVGPVARARSRRAASARGRARGSARP